MGCTQVARPISLSMRSGVEWVRESAMQITAKFAGTCPDCGGGYAQGSQVEWERDKKAKHVTCPVSRPLRLIGGSGRPSTGMNKPSPIFAVSVPSTRSAEDNVKAIEAVAHVV